MESDFAEPLLSAMPPPRAPQLEFTGLYNGPDTLALADWRTRINALYTQVRAIPDAKAARRYWQDSRSALFRDHPMSPIPHDRRAGLTEIPVYPYDPALRFEVGIEPADGPSVEVPVGNDGVLLRRPHSRTIGLEPVFGKEMTLFWIEGYGGGLFLPFKDATNGTETYGGGRYLIDSIKGAYLGLSAVQAFILDFNFAYYPSCAHNPEWICPLAPEENSGFPAIRAGERNRPGN